MSAALLIVLGGVLQAAGLAGCVLPVMAGPPLNFAGLILLDWARGWNSFSPAFLVVMGLLTAGSMILDYVLPLSGTKRYGSSKRGFWGAFIGMAAGVFAFPPLGIIIGAFLGAVIGELAAGKESPAALRAGWGAFIGFLLAMGFRLALSGVMTFAFVLKLL
ncbi:MAG: DUF456 domain-containing protein [Acidobacteriota bacterium]|nr:DUF456 domain-containing protein [Acidobacteriota bacterium]OQB59264.1 MAG: hypothetical protein BWX98_00125 [Candidatus Aminicenantes bacterium ADurb.Bin147]HNQ79658.1 DUF456 domain-containing protein [Candidatus Aminicenantes bacterium]MDD8032776.1 DUF456 domain-containing protein [Acidobacteriota bacterium]MDD8039565.1 DUF456 domain-containing protein [Acidobacteriota bacterium]